MPTPLPDWANNPTDRFALNPAATAQFLHRARRIRNGFEKPDPGQDWWYVDADWDPRDLDDDELPHLELLVYHATAAGSLTCPAGWDLQMLTTPRDADGDQMYVWRLAFWDADVPHLGFTLASECLENMTIIGTGDVKGAVAALEVLREAVTCANRILDCYVAAAGRVRFVTTLPDAHAAEIPA